MSGSDPRTVDASDHRVRLEVDSPFASLPLPARKILEAARRLLKRGGLEAVTLQAVATAAGQPKASIGYYFGDKDGLLAVLVDSLVHDANTNLLKQLAYTSDLEDRLPVILAMERRISEGAGFSQGFFDVLPRAFRDRRLRQRLSDRYTTYHTEAILRALGATTAEARHQLQPLATLMLAMVDGLTVQHALEGKGGDFDRVYSVWEEMLRLYLQKVEDEFATDGSPSDDDDSDQAAG